MAVQATQDSGAFQIKRLVYVCGCYSPSAILQKEANQKQPGKDTCKNRQRIHQVNFIFRGGRDPKFSLPLSHIANNEELFAKYSDLLLHDRFPGPPDRARTQTPLVYGLHVTESLRDTLEYPYRQVPVTSSEVVRTAQAVAQAATT